MTSNNESWVQSAPIKGLFTVEPDVALIRNAFGEETSSFAQLRVHCQCREGCAIAWKLRTNHAHRYMVSPKQGLLESGGIVTITVAVSPSEAGKLSDTDVSKDKFLIEAMPISSETDRSSISELNPLSNDGTTQSVWKMWDIRGKQHDKKRGKYVFESRTVKCKVDLTASVTISKRPSDFADSTVHREKHFSSESGSTGTSSISSNSSVKVKPATSVTTATDEEEKTETLPQKKDDRSGGSSVPSVTVKPLTADTQIVTSDTEVSNDKDKEEEKTDNKSEEKDTSAPTPKNIDRSEQFAYIRRLLAENRELSVQLKLSRERIDEMRNARDKLANEMDELRKGQQQQSDGSNQNNTMRKQSRVDKKLQDLVKEANKLDQKSTAKRNEWTLSLAIFQIFLILFIAALFFNLGGYWNSSNSECECPPLSQSDSISNSDPSVISSNSQPHSDL